MQQTNSGASTSLWHAGATLPTYPPLAGDARADVCVIGAGIGGLTTAYLLAAKGRQVILIDMDGVGAGETGRTTAHFFPPDEWYAHLEEAFGAPHAALVADSFASALALVEATIAREHIDCQFQRLDGYLYSLPGNTVRDFDREHAAAVRAGVVAERLARVPGLAFDTGPCVRFPGQAQCHPLNYLDGLARAFVAMGGLIHGATRALGIEGNRQEQTVRTEHGVIRAAAVVVATNTPFNNRVALHTRQAAYRSYVVALAVPAGSVPPVLLWDTGDPYYYVRLESTSAPAGQDALIVGGADHKVGQDQHPEHRYRALERWARERFPMATELLYQWSGEVMEPSDGPAFLGRNPMDDDNVYIITGDSGNGMTHCTIGAMVVTDLIMGLDNRWTTLYDPGRKVVHGMGEFSGEQANTPSRYAGWAGGSEVESVEQIACGHGAILNQGAHKLAVYRGAGGALQVLSAKCTHLGCVVQFNSAERSWDCPCHGSRFSTTGAVLHGPAATPLAQADLKNG